MLTRPNSIHWTCITGNRKNGIIVFPSFKIIVQKTRYCLESCKLYWGPARTCETQVGLLDVTCLPSVSSAPLHGLYVGRAIYVYWVLRNYSSVHNVAVTWSCNTLVLTTSSSSSATSSSFFILPRERVSWTFSRLLLCEFSDYVPWLSRVVFQFSLGGLWQPLTRSSLLHGHQRTIWSEWIRVWWPHLSYLSFEFLWLPLMMSSFLFDCHKNHLIWVDSIWTVALGLLQNSPCVSF